MFCRNDEWVSLMRKHSEYDELQKTDGDRNIEPRLSRLCESWMFRRSFLGSCSYAELVLDGGITYVMFEIKIVRVLMLLYCCLLSE